MTKTPKWLDDAQCVWDNSVAPGGFVCEVCRLSVESEPCREHQPGAFAESQRARLTNARKAPPAVAGGASVSGGVSGW